MGGERHAVGGLEGLGGGEERRLGVFGVPGFLMLPSALRQTARLRGFSQAGVFAGRYQTGALGKGGAAGPTGGAGTKDSTDAHIASLPALGACAEVRDALCESLNSGLCRRGRSKRCAVHRAVKGTTRGTRDARLYAWQLRLPRWVQKGVLNPEPMNLMPAGVVISGRFF